MLSIAATAVKTISKFAIMYHHTTNCDKCGYSISGFKSSNRQKCFRLWMALCSPHLFKKQGGDAIFQPRQKHVLEAECDAVAAP